MKTRPILALLFGLLVALAAGGLALVLSSAAVSTARAASLPPVARVPRMSEPPILDPRRPVQLTPELLRQLSVVYEARASAHRARGLGQDACYYDGLAAAYLFLAAAIDEGLVVLPVVSRDAPAAPAEP
jgi:hypothetical protein